MDALPEKELTDRYLAACNAFDVDGMVAVLAPDVRFENWSGTGLALRGESEFGFADGRIARIVDRG